MPGACYIGSVRVLLWIGIAAAALLLTSAWTFWTAVRPPRLAIPGTPADFRLPAEDVAIVAADGVKLAGWLIAGTARDERAVVLLHGYPAHKADLLPIAVALHPQVTVLLLDLRYFGASGGGATTLGYRERADLRRAVDELGRRGYSRIGVFGYSLGGAVAILGAAEDPRIQAVAAWAPFSDLRVLASELYGSLWVLKYPFVELLVLWSRLAFGGDITRPSPEMAAARLTIPVRIWASRDDDQISFAHAERLQRALSANPRATIHVGRGSHNERAPRFERELADFFAKTL